MILGLSDDQQNDPLLFLLLNIFLLVSEHRTQFCDTEQFTITLGQNLLQDKNGLYFVDIYQKPRTSQLLGKLIILMTSQKLRLPLTYIHLYCILSVRGGKLTSARSSSSILSMQKKIVFIRNICTQPLKNEMVTI